MNPSDPPTLAYLFLEQPWPMTIALLAVAAVLLLQANRRRERRLAIAAGIAAVAAGVIFLTATLVETSRELIMRQTEALVAATDPLNLDTVDQIVAPYATLSSHDGTIWLRYDDIRVVLEQSINRWGVEEQDLSDLKGVTGGDAGVTQFRVKTRLKQAGFPVLTRWQLHWVRDPATGQWLVDDIRWLEFQGQRPTEGMWR